MYFIEHCEKVNDRHGHMIPIDNSNFLTGFRSVYGFSEEDAQEIKSTRASRGFAKYSVFSDTWFLDFDNKDKGIKETIDWALSKKLGYKLYESGGKGYHIEIPTMDTYSIDLPFFHSEMAKKLDVGADLSIYRHSSLYRLPNTIHEKTGKTKQLLEETAGEFILQVPVLQRPEIKFDIRPLDEYGELKFALGDAAALLSNCPGNGNRNNAIWRLSMDFYKAGISFDTAFELLLSINKSWKDGAKDEEEIRRACSEGYRYLSGNDKSR